jgi:hypothetical protein
MKVSLSLATFQVADVSRQSSSFAAPPADIMDGLHEP